MKVSQVFLHSIVGSNVTNFPHTARLSVNEATVVSFSSVSVMFSCF